MGDEGEARASLLAHDQEDAAWDRAEEAPPVEEISVHGLLHQRPEGVLRYLQKRGVRKLGEFCVEDSLVLGKLGDDSIMTLGGDSPHVDYEAMWKRELGTDRVDKTGWSTKIPVLAYVVTIRDAARPDKDGLLQPLLRRWQAGGCSYSVFALPAVQAVIDWKWKRFCRRLLLWELAAFLLWLASFCVWAIVFQDEDTTLTLRELLASARGRLSVVCHLLALLGMAPFLVIEAATMWAYGWGWVSAWNLLDTATYLSQIAIVAMHLGRLNISSGWLSIVAAAQVVLLLFRLQYFSRVFRPTRFAFVDSLKEVLHDVRFYLLFLVLVMAGFATSFQILFRQDQEQHEEFSNVYRAFIVMVTWCAGNADLTPLYQHAHNPVAACLLAVVFVFVLAMVLMNLLIGIMTNTLEKVTEHEGLRMLLSKAQVIDELESTITPWVERYFPSLYPPCLHVLRVDPDKLDTVKMDNLWAREGDDEETGLLLGGEQGAQGVQGEEAKGEGKPKEKGAHSRPSVLEEKVDAVWKELQEVKALLRVPGGWHSERGGPGGRGKHSERGGPGGRGKHSEL